MSRWRPSIRDEAIVIVRPRGLASGFSAGCRHSAPAVPHRGNRRWPQLRRDDCAVDKMGWSVGRKTFASRKLSSCAGRCADVYVGFRICRPSENRIATSDEAVHGGRPVVVFRGSGKRGGGCTVRANRVTKETGSVSTDPVRDCWSWPGLLALTCVPRPVPRPWR
jgi:hypothetical protein